MSSAKPQMLAFYECEDVNSIDFVVIFFITVIPKTWMQWKCCVLSWLYYTNAGFM